MTKEVKNGGAEENLIQPATPMDVYNYAGGEDPRLPFGAVVKGPLNGIVIVAMEGVVALPTATDQLVGMGATVIKIENDDGVGDSARTWALKDSTNGMALYFQAHNTGKLSIKLNLARDKATGEPVNPEHMEVMHRLLAGADVFVENNRPGVIKKTIGWSPEEMVDTFLGLIVGSISGQGQKGPEAGKAAYASTTGAETGEYWAGSPKGNPMMSPYSHSDLYAAQRFTQGILMALYRREATGKGDVVDISMKDVAAEMHWYQHTEYSDTGKVTQPLGDLHSSQSPLGIYRASDREIVVAAANPKQWDLLTTIVGHPEWKEDERFKDSKGRFDNRELLRDLINEALSKDTAQNWFDKFNKAGIPVSLLKTIGEVQESDLTILAHNSIIPIEGTGAKRANYGLMSRSTGRLEIAPRAPKLGEHDALIRQRLDGEGLGSDFHAARAHKAKIVGVDIGDVKAPEKGVIEVVGSIQKALTGERETPTLITDPSVLRALTEARRGKQ